MRQKAFTSVELLIVIAVIAILAVLCLPALKNSKSTALRTVCLNNLKQIDLGILLYSGDSGDFAPASRPTSTDTNISSAPWIAYKRLMKSYVGLSGKSSPQDKIFSCPADVFYYEWMHGRVDKSHHDQAIFDFSSYTFNGMNLMTISTNITPS